LLQSNSLAINHARIVTEALRGMGTREYFGTTTPQGGAYDIGAAEHPYRSLSYSMIELD
jgi:hypothetical protein